jgi:class 3 adenylate cyclase/tetratricopeptide (TPR) repeat protein
MDKPQQLIKAIAELEAQRGVLSNDVIDASVVTLREKLAQLEVPEKQRKLVTILYTDIVGSTDIVKLLDPEDALEIMDGALKRLAIPVEGHGGHVARFTGDGFKAVFGAPLAQENDPEMAIRAGLGILEVAKEYAKELAGASGIRGFQVRVGVNTGLVALGGLTEAEDTVMGSPVNLAARMESAAPPGRLLISHNTYQHVRGLFDVEPLEPLKAKGFDEPVPVFLVKSTKAHASLIYTRGVEGVETRMVGRETELKLLQDALYTAIEEGEGQVVTIVGEAGVGKSRLLYEFQNWIELLSHSFRIFTGRGVQETQNIPYALLRDLFSTEFQIKESHSASIVREKVEAGFGEVLGTDEDGHMRAHIIGQLLGFDFSESPHLKWVKEDGQQLRDRAMIYLAEYLHTVAHHEVTAIFLEDIHWADDSSLDLLAYLGREIPNKPLVIVNLARQRLFERRPYWGEGETYHTRLELRPLSKRESRQLVVEVLKKVDDVPVALRELVVDGAEGNPYYIEELIKMLIEEGAIIKGDERWSVEPARLAEIDVPSTLMGVLQARLDGLPLEERTALQQASIVGRVFWDSLIEYITEISEQRLDSRNVYNILAALRGKEMVYRRETSDFDGSVEYIFKHTVLREVTYESVPKQVRKTHHGLVADWLIANGGERVGEYTGLIAEHLEQAGRKEGAILYLLRAAEQAVKQYANEEATCYYRRVLDLTDQPAVQMDASLGLGHAFILLDDHKSATAVIQQGLHLAESYGDVARRIQFLYAQAQNASRQHRSDGGKPEVEVVLLAAEQASDKYYLAQSLLLLTEVHESSGDLSSALETATLAQKISSKLNDNQLEARALVEISFLHAQLANFNEAASSAELGLKLLAETDDCKAIAYAWNILGRALGGCGDYSRALDAFHRSQEEARIIGDRYLLAQVFNMQGWLHRELGDYEKGLEFDEEGIDYAKRWNKPSPEISARLNVCLDLIHLGDPERALVLLDEIEVQINAGSFGFHSWRWRVRLLHARGLCYLALDEPTKVLALAEEGLSLAETKGTRKYVALNQEIKGMALAELGNLDEAIHELETAISLADDIQYQPIRWAGRHKLAKLYRQNRLEQEAKNTTSEAEQIIQTIAKSLEDKNLRITFLNAALPQKHQIEHI